MQSNIGLSHAMQQATDRHRLCLFSLNDYLGLSAHPNVCSAMARSATTCGLGPRSSALVGGYTTAHRQLETAVAELKGTEECLLLPTGFASNLALPAALARTNTAIFSDELNHASLVDGARLAVSGRASSSVVHVYKHCNLQDLEQKMQQEASTGG